MNITIASESNIINGTDNAGRVTSAKLTLVAKSENGLGYEVFGSIDSRDSLIKNHEWANNEFDIFSLQLTAQDKEDNVQHDVSEGKVSASTLLHLREVLETLAEEAGCRLPDTRDGGTWRIVIGG